MHGNIYLSYSLTILILWHKPWTFCSHYRIQHILSRPLIYRNGEGRIAGFLILLESNGKKKAHLLLFSDELNTNQFGFSIRKLTITVKSCLHHSWEKFDIIEVFTFQWDWVTYEGKNENCLKEKKVQLTINRGVMMLSSFQKATIQISNPHNFRTNSIVIAGQSVQRMHQPITYLVSVILLFLFHFMIIINLLAASP